jgi:hypothetical protein
MILGIIWGIIHFVVSALVGFVFLTAVYTAIKLWKVAMISNSLRRELRERYPEEETRK